MIAERISLEKLTTFSPDSNIWIYQSSREFAPQELEQVQTQVQEFAGQWKVHGKPAKAYGEVLFARFILFVVDAQTPASGCSIDASVEFVKSLEQRYEIQLMNRMNIAYFDEDNQIQILPFLALKQALKSGELPDSTIIFDNTITELSQLDGSWMVPASESFFGRG